MEAEKKLVLRHQVMTSRVFFNAMLVVALLVMVVTAISFQAPGLLGLKKSLMDFDAFHIAGTMVLEGHAEDTYRDETMRVAQERVSNQKSFMPWTYPPTVTMLVAGLAVLPIGLAYVLFITASFLFYLAVLKRIAGPYLPGVLIALLPTIILEVRTGQNGFLTGGLVGAFLLAFLERKPGAGIPLGLMIIKPHLNVGVSLVALFERRWSVLFVAAAVVAICLAIPTIVLGVGIWPAFLAGVRESGTFLSEGYYPLYRMSSVYAALRTHGLSADMAMTLHGAAAAAALGLFVFMWWRGLEPRLLAACACVVSLFVSPYNYDYDLTILGVAVAFALPRILEVARTQELVALLFLCWFVTGYGLVFGALIKSESDVASGPDGLSSPALIAPALIVLVSVTFRLLWRARSGESQRHAVARMPA